MPTRSYLTSAQQEILLAHLMDPEGDAHTVCEVAHMPAPADVPLLATVAEAVIAAAPWLRESYRLDADGTIVRSEHSSQTIGVEVFSAAQTWSAARESVMERLHEPADLERGVPTRFIIIPLVNGEGLVALLSHHLVLDAYSFELIWRRFAEAYRRGATDSVVFREPEPRTTLMAADVDDAPAITPHSLRPWSAPAPRRGEAMGGHRAIRVRRALSPTVLADLSAAATAHGVRQFHALLAATSTYLHMVGNGEVAVLGLPRMNRSDRASAQSLVVHVDVALVSMPIPVGATVAELIAGGERAHQNLRNVRLEPGTPLLNIGLAASSHRLESGRMEIEVLTRGPVEDLTITVDPLSDRPTLELLANRRRYSHDVVERIADDLQSVFTAFAATDGQGRPWSDIDLAGDIERPGDHPRPTPTSAYERFRFWVAHRPGNTAVRCDGVQITYRDLQRRVDRITSDLAEAGIVAGSRVGSAVARSIDAIAIILAVERIGATLVPIDAHSPEERVRYIAADSDLAVLLVDPASAARARAAISDGVPVLAITKGDREPHTPAESPWSTVHLDSIAYVIYTSGSTGRPKGVEMPRRAVAALLEATDSAIGLRDTDRCSLFHSHAFDFSVWEIWGALANGAEIVVVPDSVTSDTTALSAFLVENRVTSFSATPTVIAELAADGRWRGPDLRLVITGGEALDESAIDRWLGEHPTPPAVVNMYGITETCVHVTHHRVSVNDARAERGTIGRPLDGLTVSVRGSGLQRLPAGVVGQMYVSGTQLAQGYHDRPGMTAARFVADPSGDGTRMYRSGDLAEIGFDGELRYRGRADQQLKLRGFRIEPGEIEAVLQEQPGVARAAVAVREAVGGAPILVAYIVITTTGPADLDQERLRSAVRDRLPDYMVPSRIIEVDEIARSINGKVDLSRLPAPDAPTTTAEPMSTVQQVIHDEIARLLRVTAVGRDDDFFALGGNSLSATRLVNTLASRLGKRLEMHELFTTPTLSAITDRVATAPGARPGPSRRTDNAPAVLSPAQERYWTLTQLHGADATHSIPLTLRWDGSMDVDALTRAIERIVARHEPLRTALTPDRERPLRVLTERHVPIVTTLPEDQLEAAVRTEARRPIDVLAGPPIRTHLFLGADSDIGVLVLTIHHIAADEWSVGPLLLDLQDAYAVEVGEGKALSELPIRYSDYSAWAASSDGLGEHALERWATRLQGSTEEIALPRDRPRGASGDGRAGELRIPLRHTPAQVLERLGDTEPVTAFMVVQAVVATVLRRVGAGDDMVLGTAVSGRSSAEVTDLVGCFVNLLPIRIDTSGRPSFAELLHRIRAADLDAFTDQAVPFEQIIRRVAPNREHGRQALFQVMVQYRTTPEPVLLGGVRATTEVVSNGKAKVDLTFDFLEDPGSGEVELRIEYLADVFDDDTVQAIAARIDAALTSVRTDPWRSISRDELLLDPDIHILASHTADHTLPPQPPTTVHRLIEDALSLTPDRIALHCEDERLTYAELERRSRLLAHRIRALGIGREDVVAVVPGRSTDTVVALLAVIRAGAAYLPIDEHYPTERIAFMLSRADPRVVLVGGGTPVLPPGTPVLDVRDETPTDDRPLPDPGVLPDSALYLLFTSGSTGVPKPVVGTHGGTAHRIRWQADRWGRHDLDTRVSVASFGFIDGSTTILAAIADGACLALSDGPTGDPAVLAELVRRHRPAHVLTVPSIVRTLIRTNPEAVDAVDSWVCGGEPVGIDLVHAVRERSTRSRVLNTYGSTELSDDVITGAVDESDTSLGGPVPGADLFVLGDDLNRVPPGVIGELYVGGPQVTRGYADAAALTAARYIAHPWASVPGQRLYRTGDLVVRDKQGRIHFVGRSDGQLSIRGVRIEPAEVEAALRFLPDVAQAGVTSRRTESGGEQLVAFVVPVRSGIDYRELRRALAESLPSAAIPTNFVEVDSIPLSPNGKVDRTALADAPLPSTTVDEVPIRTESERHVAAAFTKVLGFEPSSTTIDFLDIGGDSISALSAATTLREHGYAVTAADILEYRTIGALAERIRGSLSVPAIDEERIVETPPAAGWFRKLVRGPVPPVHLVDLPLPQGITVPTIENALESLAGNAPALRTTVRKHRGRWQYREHSAASTARVVEVGERMRDPNRLRELVSTMIDPERPGASTAIVLLRDEPADRIIVAGHALLLDDRSLQSIARRITSGAVDSAPREPLPEHSTQIAAQFDTWQDVVHERLSRNGTLLEPADTLPFRSFDAATPPVTYKRLLSGFAQACAERDLTVDLEVDPRDPDPGSGGHDSVALGPLSMIVPLTAAVIGTDDRAGEIGVARGYTDLRFVNRRTAQQLENLPDGEVLLRFGTGAPGWPAYDGAYPIIAHARRGNDETILRVSVRDNLTDGSHLAQALLHCWLMRLEG